jgi:hypothetical protein
MRGGRGVLVVVLSCLALVAPTAAWAREGTVTSTAPPTLSGTPRYDTVVAADPGTWTPEPESTAYQWLLDGEPVAGASSSSYTPTLDDIGHELSVQVTASATGFSPGTATSAPSTVRRALFRDLGRPRVTGGSRFGQVLSFETVQATPAATRLSFQWLRAGRPIAGRTERRHRLSVADVGRLVALRVTLRRAGYAPAVATSAARRVQHRMGVRHAVTYHVETRGRITADVATFKRLAQASYDDPRGWRGGGVSFRRVARGGDITLVLAEASWLPRFSSGCSAEWSCRVGRFVVINQTRWLHASPMWHRTGGSLRDYRHMVINHETGHWLGHGHASCPGRGALAPVMQTQSKGLDGCRPNPFPVASEWKGAWRR